MRFALRIGGCALVAAGALAAVPSTSRAAIIVNDDVTAPGDPLVGVGATAGDNTSTPSIAGNVAGANNYPAAESPDKAIDNLTTSKYLNFARVNAGLITSTLTNGPLTVVYAFQFLTANDAPERDPLAITIEGTNSPNATTTLDSAWTLIYSGSSGLETDPGRNGAAGTQIAFPNLSAFSSYRVLVTETRGTTANSFQFSEIRLVGSTVVVPEPASAGLLGLAGLGLLARRRRRA